MRRRRRYFDRVGIPSVQLPEQLEGPGALLLRRWACGDAEELGRAIAESIQQLRPWMPWVADEPLSVARRRSRIDEWERGWLSMAMCFSPLVATKFPTGGHRFSPVVAIESPHRVGLRVRSGQGHHSFAGGGLSEPVAVLPVSDQDVRVMQ